MRATYQGHEVVQNWGNWIKLFRQAREVVGVVQAAQGVLQIDHMVVVRHHPGRILGADHHVEMRKVELAERLIRLHYLGKGLLRARQLDQFHRTARVSGKSPVQAQPELLCPPYLKRDRRWGDYGDGGGHYFPCSRARDAQASFCPLWQASWRNICAISGFGVTPSPVCSIWPTMNMASLLSCAAEAANQR